jgi:GT2 family glycosyltransferase
VLASRGRTIVFVDAGCSAQPGWLERLLAPLNGEGEAVVAGVAPNLGSDGLYDADIWERARSPYLPECPTINLAFRRYVYDIVHGFDETFEYGSDIDFSWRVVDAGFRIRSAPDAVVAHDWGGFKRQLKRAYAYGKARVRLYRKHRSRLWRAWRTDPMVLVYPAFLLGLPLTLRFPLYPALLVIPAARARGQGVGRVLADHLAYGAGALVELTRR